MKKYLCISLLAFAVAASAQQSNTPNAQSVIAIRAGSLIDGRSEKPRRDQVIIIRGNNIESIADAGSAKIPDIAY